MYIYIKKIIQNHYDETQSVRANFLLDNFDLILKNEKIHVIIPNSEINNDLLVTTTKDELFALS
jgi:glutamate synthase domain-containing protein 3